MVRLAHHERSFKRHAPFKLLRETEEGIDFFRSARSAPLSALVFEAKKRFGLCVLDYMVTSNHIHLLIKDTGSNVIAQSMQLIAGRTAQKYKFSTSHRE